MNMRRVFLFLGLNFAVVITVSILAQIFHISPYLHKYGINYQELALFCFIWGMCGAGISLLLSKKIAQWSLKIRSISKNSTNPQEIFLYTTVKHLAIQASLPMPEVGIFSSKEPNAFATGPTKRHALIAVSSGLMEKLSPDEIEAVIGHEITHIANGDMVTMALLLGVSNVFVLFFSKIFAYLFSSFLLKGKNSHSSSQSPFLYYIFTIIFEIIFMFVGSIILAYFSRLREYKADRGSASLLGKGPMISALKRLEDIYCLEKNKGKKLLSQESSLSALFIFGGKSWTQLFSTHPSIEKRIAMLNQLQK